MKSINKSKTVNFRITESLYDASRKASKFKKISWSLFVRDAIREKIDKTTEEWRQTHEGSI